MGFLLVLILLVLVFGAGVALTIGLVGLLLTLVMAGIVGWAADALIPGGKLPGGWIGAVLTGLIGGFVGGAVCALSESGVMPRFAMTSKCGCLR